MRGRGGEQETGEIGCVRWAALGLDVGSLKHVRCMQRWTMDCRKMKRECKTS